MISPQLKQIILKALELDDWPVESETLASEVPGWDSLNHVRVILEVERHFGVRFQNMEIMRLRNVGDLQLLLDSKRKLNEGQS